MAFKKENYPPYWAQFSKYIRFERAEGKCERCNAPNGETVERGFIGGSEQIPVWRDFETGETYNAKTGVFLGQFRSYEILKPRFSKIVLTTAHLDQKNGVCRCKRIYGFKCANPRHVQALCQGCHLSLDRPHHLAVQAKNRMAKKDSKRGLFQTI